MRQGVFEGPRGIVLTALVWTLVVAVGLALAVLLTRDYRGVGDLVRTEPGARPLPGELVCRAPRPGPSPVSGPGPALSAVALRNGEALVLAADGGLWRGDPATGALEPWAARPGTTDLDVGDPLLLGTEPAHRAVFVVGTEGLAAVDPATGALVSRQRLGEQVVDVAADTRRVYLVTADGRLLVATWVYDELGAVQELATREPLTARRAIAAQEGDRLLLVTDGPLTRLATATGGSQPLPVGDDHVPAAAMGRGWAGAVYLGEGDALRVLDLSGPWVTGRLSIPVEGWSTPVGDVVGVPAGLLVVTDDGNLALAPEPTCNREELTRTAPADQT